MASADIGLIGLAVMGSNLALNIAENGYTIAVHNRTASRIDEFVDMAKAQGLNDKVVPEADLVAFQERIRNWPAVRECWTLSGDIDFSLKCVTPDLKAFQDFVAELTAMPNVRNVRTALALDRVKDEPIVPFG